VSAGEVRVAISSSALQTFKGGSMAIELGKFEKVDLRDVWKHEATDFSAWLARAENLDALAEQLGIEIELTGTEVPVGRFKIDILAKEVNTNENIIIENQLEPTNHDHLGKVITYAAGYDARYLIWIVKDVLPEHLKAIEWLNEHLDDTVRCFLIKIEVWKIGNSNPAPRFEIISTKNDWVASIKKSSKSNGMSSLEVKQLDFWTSFNDFLATRDPNLKHHKPGAQHWMNFSMGSNLAHIPVTINTVKNRLATEIYISDNKMFYSFLRENEDELISAFGSQLDWFEANIASGFRVFNLVADVFDESRKLEYFEWFYESILKFKKVLTPYIQEFKTSSALE
jgi:hypothetical protein